MSLSRGRVVILTDDKAERTPSTYPRKGLSPCGPRQSERTDATDHATVSEAEEKAAELLPQFEESISIASARLSIQTRAEAEQELAEKFVELAVLRARVLEQSQSDIIALAQILAERVIAAELTTRPECILNLAKQTLKEARGAHCVVLHAHPTAVEMLSREIEDLASNCAAQIQVQPDPDLAPGDLQLKTDVGVIDARITTQIANLAMTIRETFRV